MSIFPAPSLMSGQVLLSRKHCRERRMFFLHMYMFCETMGKSALGTWHARGGVELRSPRKQPPSTRTAACSRAVPLASGAFFRSARATSLAAFLLAAHSSWHVPQGLHCCSGCLPHMPQECTTTDREQRHCGLRLPTLEVHAEAQTRTHLPARRRCKEGPSQNFEGVTSQEDHQVVHA